MPENTTSKKKLFRKLKHTYRLVFFNDNTFEEAWHLRFTIMNVLSLAGTIFVILVGGSMALVMFTPLRVMVPGYPTESIRRELVTNALRLDSLEYEIQIRDKYFNTLNAIIAGRDPDHDVDSKPDSTTNYKDIVFTRSEQDSLLRKQVEEEEQFNFVFGSNPQNNNNVATPRVYFFKPLEGLVVNKFNMRDSHFGVDIVASPNEVVKSILDGTVITATWTVETGYIMQIQHSGNIISVYKHNASLLKRSGDRVKAGDAIAIAGNSGELTTGPHLHFEIWINGKAVNPEDYIVF